MLDTEGGPSTPCWGPFVSLVFKACPAQSLCPLACFLCWSGIEECGIRITKTKQLNISCAVEASASSSFYLFLTSADQWCRFFSGVCLSLQGERSVWEFILISSWRQSPPHAPCAASSSIPSTQNLVSFKKGVISQSYFPVEEGYKLPSELCYSNSPNE